MRAKGLEPPHLSIPEPKSGASTNSATPAAGPPVAGVYTSHQLWATRNSRERSFGEEERIMATVPSPGTFPETPPPEPGTTPGGRPGEIVPPSPDVDVPDRGEPTDPDESPDSDEA